MLERLDPETLHDLERWSTDPVAVRYLELRIHYLRDLLEARGDKGVRGQLKECRWIQRLAVEARKVVEQEKTRLT